MNGAETLDIIFKYQKGRKFKNLTLYELFNMDPNYIRKLASEYDVKYEDFMITEEQFKEYANKFSYKKYDYERVLKKREHTDFLIFVYVVFFISLCVFYRKIVPEFDFWILNYLPYILLFVIPIVPTLLIGLICSWRDKKREEKFIEDNIGRRNKHVENFINEVMFQAYVRNRNPQIEYGYRLH